PNTKANPDPNVLAASYVGTKAHPSGAAPEQQTAAAPPSSAEQPSKVKLAAAAKLYEQPKRASNSRAVKKGVELTVHSGRKKDGTVELCEVQAGKDPHRWIICSALPAAAPAARPKAALLAGVDIFDAPKQSKDSRRLDKGASVEVL